MDKGATTITPPPQRHHQNSNTITNNHNTTPHRSRSGILNDHPEKKEVLQELGACYTCSSVRCFFVFTLRSPERPWAPAPLHYICSI